MSLFAPPVIGDERFQVPDGCGTRAEFERELERLLGSETLEPSSYDLSIAQSSEGGGYLLRMTIRGTERELGDADCRTLFKSAVVVAAASVKPDLLSAEPAVNAVSQPESSPPSSEQPSATVAQSDTIAVSPPPATAASDDSASWRGGIGIGGGAIAGLVPGVAPLVEVRGLAERARFGGLLSLRYVAVGTEELEGERGVEIRSFGGRVAALYQPADFARLTAGLEADLMLGQGTGVTTPLSDEAWSLAASLEIAAIPFRLAGIELELALSGRWAFLRPRFEIGGFGDAYRVPAFGGAGVIRASAFVF